MNIFPFFGILSFILWKFTDVPHGVIVLLFLAGIVIQIKISKSQCELRKGSGQFMNKTCTNCRGTGKQRGGISDSKE